VAFSMNFCACGLPHPSGIAAIIRASLPGSACVVGRTPGGPTPLELPRCARTRSASDSPWRWTTGPRRARSSSGDQPADSTMSRCSTGTTTLPLDARASGAV